MTNITLKNAEGKDKDLLFSWRNDERINRFFLTQAEISNEEHSNWFEKILVDPFTVLYVVYFQDTPCGALRYLLDGQKKSAIVNIHISPQYWGKGLGTEILKIGESRLLKDYPSVIKLIANIHDENIASKKIFEKNHFNLSCLIFEKHIK